MRLTSHQALAPVMLALTGVVNPAPACSEESLAGLPLPIAISALEQEGLRVFYSSDLVSSAMRVETERRAEDAAVALAEILAPFDLAARAGPNGTWLVVRDPKSRNPQAEAAADQSARPTQAVAAPPRPLDELVVSASRYELRRSLSASESSIDRRDLEYLPDIGEDAIRAVARLPGTATNGISAIGNIRGGEIEETLIRLDGLRLYAPFHLKDFQAPFSVIDPRIVSSMNVYTGGFPANFGDRMSGVVDVTTMPAQEDLYHEIGLSFFNASILSSGRFDEARGQWLASARRSNLDVLYDQFSEQPERPTYSDLFAKLSYRLSPALSLSASFLRTHDDISLSDDEDREERAAADHLDTYVWLELEHTLSNKMSGRTRLARSRLDSERRGTSEKSGVSMGALSDLRSFAIDTLYSDWSRLVGDRLILQFGGSLARLEGHYRYEDSADYDLLFDLDGAPASPTRSRSIVADPSGRQYGLFASLQYDWTDRLAMEVGLRWDRQTIDSNGESTLGPRVGARFALTERTALRANWGTFYQTQAINELQVSDGIQSFFPPQRSQHFVLGLEHRFETGARLRIEAYEKSMSELRPRFENLLNTRVLLPEIKPDRFRVAPSGASARGIEIAVDGPEAPLRWWAVYAWSRVRDRLASGQAPRSWDQTHAFGAGLNWDTDRWNVSAALTHRTGWPTTPVTLGAEAELPIVEPGALNSARMGDYRSFDLRVTRKLQLDRSSLDVWIEVTNTFNRSNPCCIEYEIGDEEDDGMLVLDEVDYLPTIPSLGLLWRF